MPYGGKRATQAGSPPGLLCFHHQVSAKLGLEVLKVPEERMSGKVSELAVLSFPCTTEHSADVYNQEYKETGQPSGYGA